MQEIGLKKDPPQVLSGRKVLWLFWNRHKTCDALDGATAFHELVELKIQNNDLEGFLVNWDRTSDKIDPMDIKTYRNLFLTKIKTVNNLKWIGTDTTDCHMITRITRTTL